MTTGPHLAFGAFASAVVASFHLTADPAFTARPINLIIAALAGGIGSLAPDADMPGSPISKTLPFIASPIQARWPHRTALHSLAGAIVAAGLVFLALDLLARFSPIPGHIPGLAASFFLGGYLGHLCVDSLTVNGVKWAWPYPRAFAYPSPRRYRIRTGDRKAERWYAAFFLLLFGSFLPLLKAGGPERTIHKTFKNFYMARADYLAASNQETALEFSGTFRHSRAPASGTGLILDVRADAFVIFCTGRVLTVGDEAEVLATSFVVEYADAVPTVAEWSFSQAPLDSVLTQIPDSVLVSGELVGQRPFAATAPIYAADEFPTVTTSGTSLRLSYASKADIRGLNVRLPEAVRERQQEIQSLAAEIEATNRELAAITASLPGTRDLLARYQLREQMTELQNKGKKLKEKLENGQRIAEATADAELAFSGKLRLRKLPASNGAPLHSMKAPDKP